MLAVFCARPSKLTGDTDPPIPSGIRLLHLNAALASATLHRHDDALAHLAEAREMVNSTVGAMDFLDMHFNATNWAVWRVAVGVELGEGPKVTEHARILT